MCKLKSILSILLLVLSVNASASDGASLEDRVAELEAQQSLNIFKFSGMLNTRYDAIEEKDNQANTEDKSNYMRLRAMLNADAQVSPQINFYSRFTTTKFFNKYATTNTATATPTYFSDLEESRANNGSQVYLEKAYADVKLNTAGTVLSFGRLPTVDGPTHHLAEGRPRMGTYPGILYNSVFDGFALSQNMASDFGQFSFKLIYTPGSQFDLKIPKATVRNGSKLNSLIDITSLIVEYNKEIKDVGQLDLMAQVLQTGRFVTSASEINSLLTTGEVGFEIGMQAITAQLSNFMNQDLQIGVSVLKTNVKNTGSINLGPSGMIYGLGATAENESVAGTTSLLAARYGINSKFAIGLEYLNGGKGTFIYDQASNYLTNFYGTAGVGQHLYVGYKMQPELSLRLGLMEQDHKYSTFTFGRQTDADKNTSTMYADLRLDF